MDDNVIEDTQPDSPNNDEITMKSTKRIGLIDSDSEEEIATKSNPKNDLYDSDTSDEGNIIESTFDEGPISRKKSIGQKPDRNDTVKKMTGKEALEQRKEIKSESQRMLRERNISLPYHKPRAYTITEFLKKRAQLPVPRAVSIKMSKDQLKQVSDKLNERIREVEEFYKSDSDEDDDDPSDDIRNWLGELMNKVFTIVEPIHEIVKEPDSLEYDFNLDDINESESFVKSTVSQLLKNQLDVRPTLSGKNDEIIDLEKNVIKPNAVKSLVEKFFKHTARKLPPKDKLHLDVIGVGSQGEIIKETVSMAMHDEDDEMVINETPGAKLKKLREELQEQIAQKRLEMWKQKHEQGDCLANIEKKSAEEAEPDILDDEEEYEISDTESEESDEEIEEPQCAYLDDAAVSDSEEDEFKVPQNKTVLRRIIKPFSDDSDDEDDQTKIEDTTLKTIESEDLFSPSLAKTDDILKEMDDFISADCNSIAKQNITENSQTRSVSDLADLCTEKFTETQELPSTQDLLNVCSGAFSIPLDQECTETKNLDEESDHIISQLLDEDAVERFKKKFESPLEENDELEMSSRKKVKRLVFSDDEDSKSAEHDELTDDEEEEEEEVEERIDLHDDEEQELERRIQEEERGGFKAADFFENEAELSESEWGSEDEDEKGLDILEQEQGDAEVFNEKKMRNELERIHMRQLLDDDNREVKILQELLLEDGELHGTGRKRQFRWKTLDSMNDEAVNRTADDNIFLDEEENEEEWRKMRYKREAFLKHKLTTDDDDAVVTNSSFKISQNVIKSSISHTEETKEPYQILSKRGSFLKRNDQVLQRLAEYNKPTAIGPTLKNSKNFVFQTLGNDSNKRKAQDGTPNVIKKLRLDNLSPAAGQQKQKSTRAKRLFNNW